jgi:hypothetical protein
MNFRVELVVKHEILRKNFFDFAKSKLSDSD